MLQGRYVHGDFPAPHLRPNHTVNDRRTQLLEASYEILGRDGLEGLHARSVAAVVGVNHAAVHYYFPHRRDLLLAVAEFARGLFEADVAKFRARAGEPSLWLEADLALFRAYCRPASRFFRVWNSLFVASQVEEPLRESLLAFTRRWIEVFAESLGAAGDDRRPDALVATLMGAALMGQLGALESLFDALEQR